MDKENVVIRGAWLAQPVQHATPDQGVIN